MQYNYMYNNYSRTLSKLLPELDNIVIIPHTRSVLIICNNPHGKKESHALGKCSSFVLPALIIVHYVAIIEKYFSSLKKTVIL